MIIDIRRKKPVICADRHIWLPLRSIKSLYYQAGSGAVVTPAQTYTKSASGCYLLEMTVPASAFDGTGNLVVGCTNGSPGTLYFDDFRFQPTAAATTAYVYDNITGELAYILGNNNLFIPPG